MLEGQNHDGAISNLTCLHREHGVAKDGKTAEEGRPHAGLHPGEKGWI